MQQTVVNFIRDAQELEVYQMAYKAALALHKVTLTFPKTEQYEMASQLRRASKSICANLVEGFAKQTASKIEFKRYITISLGSCDEIRVWLNFCYDLGYISENEFNDFNNEFFRIHKMLVKFRSKIS